MEELNFTLTSWSVAGSIDKDNKDGQMFYVRLSNHKNETLYQDGMKINVHTTGNDYDDFVIDSITKYINNY